MGDISEASIKQYAMNFQLLLQQQGTAKFVPYTTQETGYSGEGIQPIKQLGQVEFAAKTSRMPPTPLQEPSYTGRWLAPAPQSVAVPYSPQDIENIGFSPESAIMKAIEAGAARKKDAIVLAAALATAKTGKDGGTTESWSTSWDVGVNVGGTTTGLNVAKLLAGLELFATAEVDLDTEKPIIAISPKQHTNLANEIRGENNPQASTAVYQNGKLVEVCGVRIQVTNRLAAVASSIRECPMWVPSGIHYGIWTEYKTRIDERSDLSYATQCYAEFTVGATRTELGRVLRIRCTET